MLDIWQKWGCDIWEETEKMWGFSFCTSREIALSRASLAQEQHGLPSTDGSECVDGGRAGVERMTDLLQRRLLRRQREQLANRPGARTRRGARRCATADGRAIAVEEWVPEAIDDRSTESVAHAHTQPLANHERRLAGAAAGAAERTRHA